MRPLGPYCERRMLVAEDLSASRPRRIEYFWMALALVLALYAWHQPAQALQTQNGLGARLEILGGACEQDRIGNGIWYQDHYAHQLDLTSSCEQVGFSFLTGTTRYGWSTGWRFSYVDLGVLRVQATFAMRDQDQHLLPSGAHCDPTTWALCIGTGRGEQRSRGLSAGYLLERAVGPFTIGGDAGLFFYDGRFRVSVDGQSTMGSGGDVHFDWRGLQVTPYAGVTLQYGYLLIMARAYARVRAAEHGCGGCSGFANGTATQIAAGVSIPF